MRLAVFPLLMAALAACAYDSIQRVPMPNLESPVAPTAARTFILRKDQSVGSERAIYVMHNSEEIGQIGVGRYIAWDDSPGRRVLRVIFDRVMLDGDDVESLIDHNTQPGSTVYYEVSLDLSPMRKVIDRELERPIVKRLTEEEGRSRVLAAEAAEVEE